VTPERLTHLQRLEAESIHIMREVVAECRNPVMLYSVGKDSAVMLHLAAKAFHPSRPPFPLLHVDTTWKFQEMYKLRDKMAKESGMELLVHKNPDAIARNINPFDHGSALHTDIWKTEGLKQALELNKFDVVFGGARRDEEKSRSKERIFSFRSVFTSGSGTTRCRGQIYLSHLYSSWSFNCWRCKICVDVCCRARRDFTGDGHCSRGRSVTFVGLGMCAAFSSFRPSFLPVGLWWAWLTDVRAAFLVFEELVG
jgi:3'-phosphoadenosine 5'-phosphosulfate sulfotransferase (PAPS reductase)/FAD synthetase